MSVRRTMILAVAMAGGMAASQAPEFAQQYRQRIGGALEELGRMVEQFDQDASRNGLTRSGALAMHAQSAEPLFRDRGLSMERTVGRMDRLAAQRARFEQMRPLAQPLALMGSDSEVVRGTWRDFNPAVPVTPQGFAWAAAGAFAAAMLFWTAIELLRRALRATWRRPVSVPPTPVRPAARG